MKELKTLEVVAWRELLSIQAKMIISRKVYEDQQTTLVMFAAGAGEEISSEKYAKTVVYSVLDGVIECEMEQTTVQILAGSYFKIPPDCEHRLQFSQDCRFLMLIK
ncbi:hypothetical protein [Ligilactobacillus ceti]|uniref:Cupin 2 conserved barrel domain-containing protein n=1 Tax=Ligilactobacillus ceti DSM 22408 TaxID=1122146 RepID=A0A0R2KPR6_9LACO|nr:hypothetical protein [Ligilactobacillus ceti]KRN88407.1 hypothetical protein IV53_GL000371 [Ligilactobacillus ceti DSM 22408]